jgi:hypothetical protein
LITVTRPVSLRVIAWLRILLLTTAALVYTPLSFVHHGF